MPSGNGLVGVTDADVRAASSIPASSWTHLATTYDGNMLRIFVNGVQSAQLLQVGSLTTSTGSLRIGGNNIWPEWFQGDIDELRVYNRALTAGQISADMATSITNPDTVAPTAPGDLSASGSISSVALSWTAATDNTAVARYNVHRGTTAGFTPSVANRIAQPTGTTYTDTGLAAGTYYYRVTAEDAAGNIGPTSSEATGTTTGDVVAPSAPGTLSASAGAGSAALTWGAASDNVAVARYNVHRSTTAGFTPTAGNRITQVTTLNHTDAGLAAGTYYYRVTAEDAAGNIGPASNQASVTVSTAPPVGLVAAYSFDQGSGTALTDLSGSAEPRLDQRRNLGRRRKVRRSAHVRRSQRHRQRARLAEPRSHVADDPRGLDSSHRARQQLAHRPAEGADRQLRLWSLRQAPARADRA